MTMRRARGITRYVLNHGVPALVALFTGLTVNAAWQWYTAPSLRIGYGLAVQKFSTSSWYDSVEVTSERAKLRFALGWPHQIPFSPPTHRKLTIFSSSY